MSVLCLNCCCVAPAILLQFLSLLPFLLWLSSPLTHSHAKVVVITTARHLPLSGKFGLGSQALASATQSLLRFRMAQMTRGRLLAESEVSGLKGEGLLSQECLSRATCPVWAEAKAELCSGECPADRRSHFPGRILPWAIEGGNTGAVPCSWWLENAVPCYPYHFVWSLEVWIQFSSASWEKLL